MFDIGKSLKQHREYKHLTQSDLARITGLKQQNISRWESNIHIPDVLACAKLAQFYGISIDYLIGYENEDGSKNKIE